MGIGARIKEILKTKRMTIKELAEKTNIPLNTLYSITKRDDQTVRSDILYEIASALGVTVDELLYGRMLSDIKKMAEDEHYIPNEEYNKIKTEQDMFDSMMSTIAETYQQLTGLGKILLYRSAKLYFSIPEMRIAPHEKAKAKRIKEAEENAAIAQQQTIEVPNGETDIDWNSILAEVYESGYTPNEVIELLEGVASVNKSVNIEEFTNYVNTIRARTHDNPTD